MGTKEDIPQPQYTQEFNVEAVRLAESIGVFRLRGDWGFRNRAYGSGFA